MAFDPDAYLAAKGGGGSFDPDAYLAAKGPKFNDQEMHEAFTAADRLVVKNFSNDAQSAAKYLKKKHPELDIQVSPKGEIFARGQGETEYKALDPDTGFFSTDILRDAGDVLYDGAAGLLATGASALGGAAGNLPGAAAAGAGASSGLETLRQGIGKALGVNQEVDLGDVAMAGGLGAASPLLLGAGATKGLVSRGVDAVKPLAGKAEKLLTSATKDSTQAQLSRLAAGALLGENLGEGGGLKGALFAAALGNPKALQAYLKGAKVATRAAGKVIDAVPAVPVQAAPLSAWMALEDRAR